MSYSGTEQVKEAREALGEALALLQEGPELPPDVLAVAQNIAQAVGSLFEAERASSEPDGRACAKSALGSLSQTLALLQDVREEHRQVEKASEALASTMSLLFPLTTASTRPPPREEAEPLPLIPRPAPIPRELVPEASDEASDDEVSRQHVEANLGAATESNFYVGFSGEISQGGVFLCTYDILPVGTPVRVLVTLPGNLSTTVDGRVRFLRDPLDLSSEAEPGMGIAFDVLEEGSRALMLRFIRNRAPMFYDE
jgi:hypothetical protein